jgi:5'-deoxynucleotidase YfbR-like HD superfamily hydrolase
MLNTIYRYLEDIRQHMKQLKKEKATAADKRERKRQQKRIEEKRQHLKVLVKYLDKDYAQVKNR